MITIDEWINSILKYFDLFNNIGTPFMEKHYIVQVLTYILDFQSLGSIDLTNEDAVIDRAEEVFFVWQEYLRSFYGYYFEESETLAPGVSKDDVIDISLLEERWKQEPIALSAEKIIACCLDCIEVDFIGKRRISEPLMCRGGTLDEGWSLLRESGTPTAQCIGYNMDSY
jgi:hypothetical protein